MDTLAYLHFAITYEASTNSEQGTVADDNLFFQELDWTKCRSAAWIPLFFFAIALFSLSLASPTLGSGERKQRFSSYLPPEKIASGGIL
jgi:hypothetical protein